MKRILARVIWAGLLAISPTAAFALSCSDFSTQQKLSGSDGFSGNSTIPTTSSFAAGDTLTFSISWSRTAGGAATATLDLNDGVTVLASRTVGVSGLTGGPVSFAAITLGSAVTSPDAIVEVPNTNGAGFANLWLQCTPAAAPPSQGPTGTSSNAIDTLQDGQVQAVAFRSADMVRSLARGGIDAAFATGDDSSMSAFGYAGSLIFDATPAEMASAGFNIWTGARFDAALPGTGQWTGGQASLAGGINYRVDERWIVGVFAALDAANYNLNADSVTNRGVGLGIVTAYRLDDTWRVEFIGSVERLGYDLKAGATTASFDATRVTLDGTLRGVIPLSANIDFSPDLGLMFLREEQSAFTDSGSTAHAANSITAGELSLGGTFFLYPTNGDMVFSLGGHGLYAIAATNGGFSASVDAGVVYTLAPNASLALEAGLSGVGHARGLSASLQAKLTGSL